VAQNELTHTVFPFDTQANDEGNSHTENWRSISSAWHVTPIILSLLLYEETNFILWICWTVESSLLIVNNDCPTFNCEATMLCSWKFVTNDSEWNGTLLIRDVMWRGGHESVHTDCFRFCLLTINIVTNSCVTLLTIQRSFLLKITLDGIQNETEAT